MEVKEMRKKLRRHCQERVEDCIGCVFAEFCEGIAGMDFETAPEEVVYKWYAMAFPEPVFASATDAIRTLANQRMIFADTPCSTIIKDSGERRQFFDADGKPIAVRDMSVGKGRMDLLPWAAIMEVSKHCENGAIKYGEHNVDKGLPTSSFCDSAARHLAKYLDGWTDEPHLLAAAWNLLWAVQMTVKKPEMVDTPWKGGA